MTPELRDYLTRRAGMVRDMRQLHQAGDHATSLHLHRLLELQHTRRYVRAGGALTLRDVASLAIRDAWARTRGTHP